MESELQDGKEDIIVSSDELSELRSDHSDDKTSSSKSKVETELLECESEPSESSDVVLGDSELEELELEDKRGSYPAARKARWLRMARRRARLR